MKRILFTILGLLIYLYGISQTEGSVQSQAVASADSINYYIPVGWKTAPTNRKLLIYHWPGSGATSFSALMGEYPMKLFYSDGWNGKFVLSPGDTLYVGVVTTRASWMDCNHAVRHMDYVFANFQMDTTQMLAQRRTMFTGYSLGGGEMSKPITGFCFDGSDWYNHVTRRFYKYATAATGSWQNVTKLDTLNGKCFYWGLCDPADGTVSVNNTRDVYNHFGANPATTGYSVKKSEPTGIGHSGADDSLFSIRGTTANTNLYLWMHDTAYALNLDCRYNMNKYIDYRKTMNYSGGGFADSLQITAGYDPEFGTSPTPSQGALPSAKIYYQQASQVAGSWEVAYNFRGTWKLNKFWYYVGGASTATSDSFFVYKGNDTIGWTRIARVDVPYASTGWFSYSLPTLDTIRTWLKVVVHGTWNGAQGTVNNCALKKIIFYGCPAGTIDSSAILPYSGARRKPTYGNFMGVNNKLGYDLWSNFRGYKNIRTQQFNNWFDDIGTYATPQNTLFNLNHFGEWDGDRKRSERKMLDSAKILGKTTYTTQVGAGQYYTNASGVFEGWYLDTLGQNPYDTASHQRSKYMFYAKAASYGTVVIDTNLIPTYGQPRFSGDSSLLWMGAENEANGNWKSCDTCVGTKRYLSPKHLAVAGQMKYKGIRMADNTGRTHLVMDTWPDLDTAATKTLITYSKQTRSDGVNIYDAFTFNNYNIVGLKAQHPVEYNLYNKLKSTMDFVYQQDPNLQAWGSENGYDRNSASVFSTPLPTGRDSGQWQADLLDYLTLDYLAAGFDRFYLYDAIGDRADGDVTAALAEANSGNFATTHQWYIARASAGLPYVFFPGFWVGNQRMALLQNYYVDSVRSYAFNGITVYKLRNAINTDSVIYAVGRPSYTSTTQSYGLYVGNISGSVTKITMSYTSDTWSTSTLSATGGTVTDTMGPRIQWYAVKEATPTPTQYSNTRYRLKIN